MPVARYRPMTIESKYLLPRDKRASLIALLEAEMHPCNLRRETRFNVIESTYFDSPELDHFRAHFENRNQRFKLRIRRYAPDGVWDVDSVFLELKSKRNEICENFNARLSPEDQTDLMKHDVANLLLSADLLRRNRETEFRELARRIREVNLNLRGLRLRPTSRLTYSRRVFEADDFQVNLDEAIQTEILCEPRTDVRHLIRTASYWPQIDELAEIYSDEQAVILEIKHGGTTPDWLNEYLIAFELSEVRFSKYCFSVATGLCTHRVRNTKKTGDNLTPTPQTRF